MGEKRSLSNKSNNRTKKRANSANKGGFYNMVGGVDVDFTAAQAEKYYDINKREYVSKEELIEQLKKKPKQET